MFARRALSLQAGNTNSDEGHTPFAEEPVAACESLQGLQWPLTLRGMVGSSGPRMHFDLPEGAAAGSNHRITS